MDVLVDSTNRASDAKGTVVLHTPSAKTGAAAAQKLKTPTSTSFHSRSQVKSVLSCASIREHLVHPAALAGSSPFEHWFCQHPIPYQ